MSSASHATNSHDEAHGHHEGGESHSTISGYLTGFVLSVVLTVIPFWLVMARPIEDGVLTSILVIFLAVAQIFVHMVYFLHMDAKSEGGWTVMALIFTVVLLVITISGSLWVMYHLNQNMMPMGGMHMEDGEMEMNAGGAGHMIPRNEPASAPADGASGAQSNGGGGTMQGVDMGSSTAPASHGDH
ncbi:cytochrome o ubiquinol oxidase subunit IV [Jiella sp. KSK16Y-1]|uniref:Cytochrome bo(3) ubiquinol oxidase subunit 4 n=1 Tax=Jiella mangrovi TaxID=2821407 RepID=A0ABS4BL78_9HYPH|nr:cytochrome o ubiquinol oxidase subunit IV [Jiella mangrovi]